VSRCDSVTVGDRYSERTGRSASSSRVMARATQAELLQREQQLSRLRPMHDARTAPV